MASRAPEHGIIGGLAAGLATVEKYSYQEWLNEQQLKTDQMRREAEFAFQQNTAQARRDMAREDALATADTEAEIFDRQADMRAAQNQEQLDFELERLRALAPEELKQAIYKEEQLSLFDMRFREKYADELDKLAGLEEQQKQKRQQSLVKLWRKDLEDALPSLDSDTLDKYAVKIVTGVETQPKSALPVSMVGNARPPIGAPALDAFIDGLKQEVGEGPIADDVPADMQQTVESLGQRLKEAVETADYDKLLELEKSLNAQTSTNNAVFNTQMQRLMEVVQLAKQRAGNKDQFRKLKSAYEKSGMSMDMFLLELFGNEAPAPVPGDAEQVGLANPQAPPAGDTVDPALQRQEEEIRARAFGRPAG